MRKSIFAMFRFNSIEIAVTGGTKNVCMGAEGALEPIGVMDRDRQWQEERIKETQYAAVVRVRFYSKIRMFDARLLG